LYGVRPGDPIDALPFDRVTETEPRDVAEWRRVGGRAYIDQCCFAVANDRIEKIWVRDAPLLGIPIRGPADITRLFGEHRARWPPDRRT
jgi:hypothetical protein